mgnify:FL=1
MGNRMGSSPIDRTKSKTHLDYQVGFFNYDDIPLPRSTVPGRGATPHNYADITLLYGIASLRGVSPHNYGDIPLPQGIASLQRSVPAQLRGHSSATGHCFLAEECPRTYIFFKKSSLVKSRSRRSRRYRLVILEISSRTSPDNPKLNSSFIGA